MIDELRENFYTSFNKHIHDVNRAKKFVKIFLILGGSLAAGLSAFYGGSGLFEPTDGEVKAVQVIGVVGALAAFVGGYFFAVIDNDAAAQELEIARRSIDELSNSSRFRAEIGDEIDAYDLASTRLTSLYYALSLARGTVEQAVTNRDFSEIELIQTCLLAAERQLRISLGFAMQDFWTVCIYQRYEDNVTGQAKLKCIAHDRAVPCDLSRAREWAEGVGVGGIALVKNDEVVLPDIRSPAIGTAFRLDGDMMKEEDFERYRSLFAVPITVGEDEIPWGVVMATSSRAFHFGNTGNYGVDPEEAVRSLAGITALSVAVCRER